MRYVARAMWSSLVHTLHSAVSGTEAGLVCGMSVCVSCAAHVCPPQTVPSRIPPALQVVLHIMKSSPAQRSEAVLDAVAGGDGATLRSELFRVLQSEADLSQSTSMLSSPPGAPGGQGYSRTESPQSEYSAVKRTTPPAAAATRQQAAPRGVPRAEASDPSTPEWSKSRIPVRASAPAARPPSSMRLLQETSSSGSGSGGTFNGTPVAPLGGTPLAPPAMPAAEFFPSGGLTDDATAAAPAPVRVCVRVRPLKGWEDRSRARIAVTLQGNKRQVVDVTVGEASSAGPMSPTSGSSAATTSGASVASAAVTTGGSSAGGGGGATAGVGGGGAGAGASPADVAAAVTGDTKSRGFVRFMVDEGFDGVAQTSEDVMMVRGQGVVSGVVSFGGQ